jgi:hypothetical protein
VVDDREAGGRLTVRFAAALTGAVALAAPLAGCEAELSVDSSCESAERVEYPDLEELATETLANVEHTLSRFSQCEDRGTPHALVIADVQVWSSRQQVNEHLASLNWTKRHGSITFDSPDEAHTAQPVMSAEPGQREHVSIYFSSD